MSKMSQLNAMLTEQAYELGYKSLEEALSNGWVVDYETQILTRKEYEKDEQEEAHKAWLKRKERTLKELRDLQEILETLADGEPHEVSSYWADTIWGAINFIEEGEI